MAHRSAAALAFGVVVVVLVTLGTAEGFSGARGAGEGGSVDAQQSQGVSQGLGKAGPRRSLLVATGAASSGQQVVSQGVRVTADVTAGGPPKCGLPEGAVDAEEQDRLPPWRPTPNRYLLASCHRSGWTNRLFCMQRALVMAALLNRTLVVGTLDPCRRTKEGDAAERMIDVPHLRRCLRMGVLQGNAEPPRHCMARSTPSSGAADTTPAASDDSPNALGVRGAAHGRWALKGQSTAASASGALDAVKAAVGARGLKVLELKLEARVVLQAAEEEPGMGVISLEEYLCMHGVKHMHVDLLMCTKDIGDVDFCPPRSCHMAGRVVFPRPSLPPVNIYDWYHGDPSQHSITYPLNVKSLAVLARASRGAPVLSLGDTFFTHHLRHAAPVAKSTSELFGASCGLLLRPPLDVFGKAAEFTTNVFEDQPYASVHLRRGDFAQYCRGSKKCKYPSVEQIAEWLSKELNRQGLKYVFIASNGKVAELQRLSDHLAAQGITMAMLQPRLGWSDMEYSSMDWAENDAPSQGFNSLDLVDHVLCAKARTYYFSHGSSFSLRIMQIRDGLRARSCEDKLLCADCK